MDFREKIGHSIVNLRNVHFNKNLKMVRRSIESNDFFENVNNKSILVCAMIRNEDDIIDLWLENIGKIQAQLFVIDHKSDLSTSTKLKSFVEVNGGGYFRLVESGYYQMEAMSFLLERAKTKLSGQTLVIPLDADEFISQSSIDEIARLLSSGKRSVAMRWRNGWLKETPGSPRHSDLQGTDIHLANKTSPIWKSATTLGAALRYQLKWAQGNHLLHDRLGRWVNPAFSEAAEIVHLPIRTEAQLREKLSTGLDEYRVRNKIDGNGFHWGEIHEFISTNEVSIQRLVGNYGLKINDNFIENLEFEAKNLGQYLFKNG
jgi:hypothetical protein